MVKNKTENKKIRNIKWMMVVLWMVLIFSFSAQPASTSGKLSLSTGHMIGYVLIPHFEKQTVKQQEAFALKIEHGIRKLAHFTEYTILAMLIMTALGPRAKAMKGHAFAFGGLYAVCDEIHQIFVKGRSCQITDMIVDCMGVLTGIILFLFICKAWKQNKRQLIWLPFILYLIIVCFYTIMNRDVSSSMRYELNLFWSYRLAWGQGMVGYQEEIVNNIWLFVPFGIMAPFIYPKINCLWKVLLWGLVISSGIEVIQLVFRIGLFEFDDMFNNTIGAVLGYAIFILAKGAYLYIRKSIKN